jgi:hypothetical protein
LPSRRAEIASFRARARDQGVKHRTAIESINGWGVWGSVLDRADPMAIDVKDRKGSLAMCVFEWPATLESLMEQAGLKKSELGENRLSLRL